MKKIFKPALLAVFAVLTAVNVYKAQTDVQLSDAQLKNVEALASGEDFKEFYCMGSTPMCDEDKSGNGQHLWGEKHFFPPVE